MLSFSISYPYLIEFHDFADNIHEGMKHQIGVGGCNSGPTGHGFPDNSNIYFLFFTMRIAPFSKCENRSGSQIGYQVRTWEVLTSSENLQSGSLDSWHLWFSQADSPWEPGWTENQGRFSANGWEPPPDTGRTLWKYVPRTVQNCEVNVTNLTYLVSTNFDIHPQN